MNLYCIIIITYVYRFYGQLNLFDIGLNIISIIILGRK